MRERAGMTQRDLAEAVGWDKSLIAKIELGERRVDLIEFFWLVVALGLEPRCEASAVMTAISRRTRDLES